MWEKWQGRGVLRRVWRDAEERLRMSEGEKGKEGTALLCAWSERDALNMERCDRQQLTTGLAHLIRG